jgi:hypothetical protein
LSKTCLDLKYFKRLIDKGDEMVVNEMDIVKILKSLRELKFNFGQINKNSNLNFELCHSKEYVIDLDSDE